MVLSKTKGCAAVCTCMLLSPSKGGGVGGRAGRIRNTTQQAAEPGQQQNRTPAAGSAVEPSGPSKHPSVPSKAAAATCSRCKAVTRQQQQATAAISCPAARCRTANPRTMLQAVAGWLSKQATRLLLSKGYTRTSPPKRETSQAGGSVQNHFQCRAGRDWAVAGQRIPAASSSQCGRNSRMQQQAEPSLQPPVALHVHCSGSRVQQEQK